MDQINYQADQEKNKSLDIRNEIYKYIPFWFWFVGFTMVSVFVTYLYLRYTPNTYETVAKVKLIDNSAQTNITVQTFSASRINYNDEIEAFTSYRIVEKVVNELNLTTSYYSPGRLVKKELWKNNPITIIWLSPSSSLESFSKSLAVTYTKNNYKIEELGEKVMDFNKIYSISGIKFKIIKTSYFENFSDKKIIIEKSTLRSKISSVTQKLSISKDKVSDFLNINMKGINYDKCNDIVNCLIKTYDNDGITDRQLSYKNTIDFINNRFIYISEELDSIETNKVFYKKNNNLISYDEFSGKTSMKKTDVENKLYDAQNQIVLSNFIAQKIKFDNDFTFIPNDIGVLNENINAQVIEYNNYILEREKLLISAGTKNPTIEALNGKLNSLQENILKSIDSYKEQLKVSLNNLENLQSQNNLLYGIAPQKEKDLRAIEREQNIKENLYLLLLQKREESALNMVSTNPSLKVLEYAQSNGVPVAPKKLYLYLIALTLGIFVPFILIFIRFYLDTKIHSKEELTSMISNTIPIIGEIPFINNTKKLIEDNDRSILAESFRHIRTNINYMLPLHEKKSGYVIFSTSSIKGEGKTFNAINVALILTQMKKRVILIGADLRNPQLHKYIDVDKTSLGLSTYLYDSNTEQNSIIQKSIFKNDNLDIILSGAIPPNPSELLSNGRLEKLITELKNEYDYIIVDSAPTLLVTDTLLLTHLSDLVLYIVRADFTEKNLIKYPEELKKNGKIKNVAYIINSIGIMNVYGYNYKYNYSYGYGYNYNYGYGYGYGSEENNTNEIESDDYNEMSTFEKIVHKIKEKI
jgi:capsular exopolysaccharide synthesis family protein